jgi:multiple sugar transport system substrate-binding protein
MTAFRTAAYGCLLLGVLLLACRSESPPPDHPADSPTDILLWHGMFTPQMHAFLERTIARFNAEHPAIHVEIERYVGHQDEAARRLQLKVALDERPDLAWLPPPYTSDLARSGALRPVADFIATDSAFDASDFYPWLWKASSYKGTRFTLPYQTNSLALLYNKQFFREAGLSPPKTWDELVEAARRLTVDRNEDGTPERHGLMLPLGHREWTVWIWETFLWQAGGELLTADQRNAAFHGEAGREALQLWVDLVYTHRAARLSVPEEGWNVTPFINGEVAMQITGPWYLSQLHAADDLEFGVTPLPCYEQCATNIGGENLYILQTTPEREAAAWTLATYLVEPRVQRERLQTIHQFPSRRSVAESDWMADYLRSRLPLRTFYEVLEHGRMRPSIPGYFAVSQALGHELERALRGDKPVADALRDAADRAETILRQSATPAPDD